MIAKYILAWIPMVFIAIGNGVIRQFVYGQWLNELSAHQISCFTGILLFLGYTLLFSSRRPWTAPRQAWLAGSIWLVLTVAFEFIFGYFVMGHSLDRLLQDYNLAAGRLWTLVLVALFFMPYATYRIRRKNDILAKEGRTNK